MQADMGNGRKKNYINSAAAQSSAFACEGVKVLRLLECIQNPLFSFHCYISIDDIEKNV